LVGWKPPRRRRRRKKRTQREKEEESERRRKEIHGQEKKGSVKWTMIGALLILVCLFSQKDEEVNIPLFSRKKQESDAKIRCQSHKKKKKKRKRDIKKTFQPFFLIFLFPKENRSNRP